MTLHEFDIIKQFFAAQRTHRPDVVVGIGDDCAVVDVPSDQQLVMTMDTLVADIHFFNSNVTTPYEIGYKALAVNLSDLAAMGAMPAWITLGITLPQADETWLKDFCKGLFHLAQKYNVQLIGGDLTRGPLTITIQAHGFVPKNQAIKRSGAKPGDLIYVTNTLGDAALGLLILQNKITVPEQYKNDFIFRLHQPYPQIEMGISLRHIANSAIDISDGLAADLNHILQASKVGAVIEVDRLPLSNALRECIPLDEAYHLALTGGDDYELCFTIPPEHQAVLNENVTCIGVITEKAGLDLRFKDGRSYNRAVKGYKHF